MRVHLPFRRAALVIVPLSLAALGSIAACSSTETDTGSGTTSDTALLCAQAGAQSDGQPPGPPEKAAPPDASEIVFAVSKLYFGNTDLDDKPSTKAWMGYGFNLDDTVSTPKAACVCEPVYGAKPSLLSDGLLGQDNSFGKNLVPILSSLSSDFHTNTNAALAAGSPTWLLRLAGVGPGTEYAGLHAEAYESAALLDAQGQPLTPKLDGSDVWPIGEENPQEGAPASPRVTFEDAYVLPREGGGIVWVGHGKGSIRLRATYPGDDIRAVIHDPVLVLPISADRTRIEHGMLGGTLDTDELVGEIGRVFGFFTDLNGESLCPPNNTYESIVQQVSQTSDMLSGGAVNLDKECDRISIGIAFDAVPAALGAVTKAPPLVDPCAGK